MRNKLILAGAALLALAACNKNTNNGPVDFSQVGVRVEPVITRATETDFESGDAIGLTIVRAAGTYAENEKLTYGGSAFSGDLNWYGEGTDEATLKAYYPFAPAVPTSFSVAADQSAGTASSDFLSAVKENVLPSANAVAMVFKHRLSRLVVTVQNNTGADIESVVFKGLVPTAVIDADLQATVDETASPVDIKAFHSGEKYYVIVPGQTVAPVVTVTAGDEELTQHMEEVSLVAGKQYRIGITVNPAELKVILSGEIENWTDGGEILVDKAATEEHLDEGYILYADTRYSVAKMKDNKWWMTQNLAYLPEGYTPSTDLNAVTAGIFAPIRVNAAGSGAEFSTDADLVAANGYLYQAEVALGLQVGDLQSVEAAEALEGTRGICPKGWHVPTIDDIIGLVGKAVSPITTNAEAPYYNGANGSISLLNADGFNLSVAGAISIGDNTRTAGTFMGYMSAYPNQLSSSMMCGSSYATVTYNTSGDATSGVKNLMFYGLMPMTNKATEAEYTCNGTKVGYRVAGPLRCVRD